MLDSNTTLVKVKSYERASNLEAEMNSNTTLVKVK